MFSTKALALALGLTSLVRGTTCPFSTGTTISSEVTGPVNAQWVSCPSQLDGPKISAVNDTTYDWWYFDVVSSTDLSSLTVVFFTASPDGFPTLSASVVPIQVTGSWPNGTLFSQPLSANSATVTTVGQGSSGSWAGTGASWTGKSDMSKYVVTINNSTVGISGTFTLNSCAPAHYPCNAAVSGANLQVMPGVGWSNAVPDAYATVDMTIGGERLSFSGVGYHDKNWGVVPFFSAVGSWYWGHARLGPYSMVWFDTLNQSLTEFKSAYVAIGGTVIYEKCSGITVRPINSAYPPTTASGIVGDYTISADLGVYGKLAANVTATAQTIAGFSFYGRWIGDIVGTVGGVKYTGVAQYESFNIFAAAG